MVVYNAKTMLNIESEHVCTNYVPWSYWDVLMYHLVLQLCLLKHKTCRANFMKFAISSFMLDPIYRFTCQELCFFYPYVIDVELF